MILRRALECAAMAERREKSPFTPTPPPSPRAIVGKRCDPAKSCSKAPPHNVRSYNETDEEAKTARPHAAQSHACFGSDPGSTTVCELIRGLPNPLNRFPDESSRPPHAIDVSPNPSPSLQFRRSPSGPASGFQERPPRPPNQPPIEMSEGPKTVNGQSLTKSAGVPNLVEASPNLVETNPTLMETSTMLAETCPNSRICPKPDQIWSKTALNRTQVVETNPNLVDANRATDTTNPKSAQNSFKLVEYAHWGRELARSA